MQKSSSCKNIKSDKINSNIENSARKGSILSSQETKNFSKKYSLLYSQLNPVLGIRPKKMSLLKLKFMIEEIYSFCFYEDSNLLKSQLNKNPIYLPDSSFPQFTYKIFNTKYPKKLNRDQIALDFLISLDYYSVENKEVEIFSKFLTEEYKREELTFFLLIRNLIEKESQIFFLQKAEADLQLE